MRRAEMRKAEESVSLELDDLVVKLQRLVRAALLLQDIGHLRVDDGQL